VIIRPVQRAAGLIVLAVCAALAVPAGASAHANLVSTTPADRAVLAQAPERVVVRFDDDVRVAPGNAAVRNGDGSILGGKPAAHGKTLVLPLRTNLGQDDYSVRWSAVSDDGHVVQGVIAFGVGLGRPPPVPTLRSTVEVGFGTVLSRWVFFAGLLVASGLALFDLLVWRPLVKSDLRMGWIAIGLAAMFVSSHGLVHASHGGASTRFGLAIYIGSAVAATGAAAAAIAVTDRSAAPFAVVLAVAVLPVPTVAGHALDPGRSWLEVPVDLLHVIAAAVWIGGLFALAFVAPREGVSPEVVGAAARRFSNLALASVIVVALTGAARALAELSAVSQLWTTGYGRAILVKTGLFAVLLGLGSVSRSRVMAGAERLRGVVLAEVTILLLGVVVAVALLTSLRPGRR
jgi:copper transport protein